MRITRRWKEFSFPGGYRFRGFSYGAKHRSIPWNGSLPSPQVRDRVISTWRQDVERRIEEAPVILIYKVESGIYPRSLELDFSTEGFRIDRAITALHHRYSGRPLLLLLGKSQRRSFAKLFPGGLTMEELSYGLIDDRYPAHFPALLLREVMGGEVPGAEELASGEVPKERSGLLRLEELAGLMGERDLRWSSVALCGPGFKENGYLNIPTGASLGEAVFPYLHEGGWRIIKGDPMDGEEISDYSEPVGPELRTLSAITEGPREEIFSWLRWGADRDSRFQSFLSRLLFTPFGRKKPVTALRGDERTCFACGACSAACPAGLLPQWLHRLVETEAPIRDLNRFRLLSCYDCGLCTYLCPAKIDLSVFLHRGRKRLKDALFSSAEGAKAPATAPTLTPASTPTLASAPADFPAPTSAAELPPADLPATASTPNPAPAPTPTPAPTPAEKLPPPDSPSQDLSPQEGESHD